MLIDPPTAVSDEAAPASARAWKVLRDGFLASASGVTARTAEDLAWLSDGYGWRGQVQEGLEAVKTAVADLLPSVDVEQA